MPQGPSNSGLTSAADQLVQLVRRRADYFGLWQLILRLGGLYSLPTGNHDFSGNRTPSRPRLGRAKCRRLPGVIRLASGHGSKRFRHCQPTNNRDPCMGPTHRSAVRDLLSRPP